MKIWTQNTSQICQRGRLTDWAVPREKSKDKWQYSRPVHVKAHSLCQKQDWLKAHSPVTQPHLWQKAPLPRAHRPPSSTSPAKKSHWWPASTIAQKNSLQLPETASQVHTPWPQQLPWPELPPSLSTQCKAVSKVPLDSKIRCLWASPK